MAWLGGINPETYNKMAAVLISIALLAVCSINLIAGFWFGSAAVISAIAAFVLTPRGTSLSSVWVLAIIGLAYVYPTAMLLTMGVTASLNLIRWAIANKE
jgi:hypothetical protein